MKRANLFNDEIEAYTNPSTVKYWVLALVIFAGMMFMGHIISIMPYIVSCMDLMVG